MDFSPTIGPLLNFSLPDVEGQPIEEHLLPLPLPHASFRRDT